MAILLLTAFPACQARIESSGDSGGVMYPFGQKYGVSLIAATTLNSIKQEVARFGNQVLAKFPDASFVIRIELRQGDVTPPGFEEARAAGRLGQCAFARYIPRNKLQLESEKVSRRRPE
jgi:hypothetical protein